MLFCVFGICTPDQGVSGAFYWVDGCAASPSFIQNESYPIRENIGFIRQAEESFVNPNQIGTIGIVTISPCFEFKGCERSERPARTPHWTATFQYISLCGKGIGHRAESGLKFCVQI